MELLDQSGGWTLEIDENWERMRENCNGKNIHECRIQRCMLNVRKTKLSRKFQFAQESCKNSVGCNSDILITNNPLLQNRVSGFCHTLCASQSIASNLAQKIQTSGFVLSLVSLKVESLQFWDYNWIILRYIPLV